MTRLIDFLMKIEPGWKQKLLAEFSDTCKKSDLGLWCPRSRSLDFYDPRSYRLGNKSAQVSNSEYFQKLCEFMDSEYKSSGKNGINPAKKKDVFKALRVSPFAETKVVILGQDPYPDSGNAHGLAFSVPNGVNIPDSLRHIFRVLYEDIVLCGKKCNNNDWNNIKPVNGCLETWAAQKNVLLLNAALTIKKEKVSEHTRPWQPFTTRILKILNEKSSPVVFLLWGDNAIDIGRTAGLYEGVNNGDKPGKSRKNRKGNLVLDASHPSNYSWETKMKKASQAFRGCRHFSETNTFLGEKIFAWPLMSSSSPAPTVE